MYKKKKFVDRSNIKRKLDHIHVAILCLLLCLIQRESYKNNIAFPFLSFLIWIFV